MHMQGHIKKIFERVTLQQMRSFLLSGVDDFNDDLTLIERITNDQKPIFERLEKLCPDETELDNAVCDLSQALTAYENAYMEIGMKAGARLVYTLLLENTADCTGNI